MQTFRSFTPAVSAALLAGIVVTAGTAVRTLVGAQEAAPSAATDKGAPAGPAKADQEPKAEPQATPEDPKAVELMRDAYTRLMERASVRARLRETVFLGDRRTTSEGTYLSGTFPMLRVEYRVQVGRTAGVLTEVCDGNVVHTRKELVKLDEAGRKAADAGEGTDEAKASVVLGKLPASEPKYTRCDVQQVAKAIQEGSRPIADLLADAGVGGLPATIASLRRCMVFDAVRESRTKSGTFTVVEGRWNGAHLDKITSNFGPGGAGLKQVVPERVAVYLDPMTLFPTRIVYLRRVGEGEKALRPVLALEFLDVQFDAPVPVEQFSMAIPSNVDEKDETAEFIAYIKPPTAAPASGKPATELLPGIK